MLTGEHMQITRYAKINNREVPVLISDEKEALLAAKEEGRAVIGVGKAGSAADIADYVTEFPECVDNRMVERVARRVMGLPWHIAETDRLIIRELAFDDFDEVFDSCQGFGYGSVEEFIADTKHGYEFHEFGYWAVTEKESGELAGLCGFALPPAGEDDDDDIITLHRPASNAAPENGTAVNKAGTGSGTADVLELGYHIFIPFREKGYAREACKAVLDYAEKEFVLSGFVVRIRRDNEPSLNLARKLGFS